MIKVGVTGGIGSGKTTFCKVLEELGAFVLYADDLAKELMVSDPELISKLKQAFGDESYHADGSLNRGYLAKEAFEKGRVQELNEIVHPILWKRADEISQVKEEEGCSIFVKEAAILLQNGRPENVDQVILLLADQKSRIERVKSRDKTDEKKVQDRILKQQDFEKLTHLADRVVVNNESIEELKMKARETFHFLKSIG